MTWPTGITHNYCQLFYGLIENHCCVAPHRLYRVSTCSRDVNADDLLDVMAELRVMFNSPANEPALQTTMNAQRPDINKRFYGLSVGVLPVNGF